MRVALEHRDGIARLTLARPRDRNAIDPEMVDALAEAVDRVGGAAAVLIGHEGPAFSVGGDLLYLRERADRLPDALEPMVAGYHQTLARIAELPVPVVCAARGAVAGGALGLLWCADVTVVAQDAKLTAGFLKLGLSGDGGSTWWLPRLVGLQRARELLLAGRVLSGVEAQRWGLVTQSVPAEEVDAEGERVARELAALPREAYAEVRKLLAGPGLRAALDAERDAIRRTGASEEARARVGAFGRPGGRAPVPRR